MKKDVHPEYREVLFHDTSIDKYFVVPSSLMTDETKEQILQKADAQAKGLASQAKDYTPA